ncbi:hypothetical protein [Streptomyces sp. HUAS 14-6]|uniref:Lipoprotein n=1 Tax=Streptomyces albidocamelliae TaxID=2981135 RepID=A0ABY6EY30_9ACTN|nr:hypothetical protein [Streptomyces sp. HUAS 14-6]UXY39231.1 hypothetical protein N8I86_33675 [Streptomyces sp. HUAS 14-6]
MHHQLRVLTALAALLFTSGCVHIPAHQASASVMEGATVRAPSSAVTSVSQAPARGALVDTGTDAKPGRPARRHGARHRSWRPAPHPRPRLAVRSAPRHRTAPHRPAPVEHRHRTPRPHPARPRAPRPGTTDDMRTVCRLAHQPAAPAEAGTLCDTYLR